MMILVNQLRKWNGIGFDGFTEKGYRYRHRALYIRYYFDAIPGTLSCEAWTLLMMLAEIMNDENMLVYRVKRKSKFRKIVFKPYDKEELRERIRYKFGKNKFDKAWAELSKHCIKKITYYDFRAWAVNPAVISKCRDIPLWLCAEFFDYMVPFLTASACKKLRDNLNKYMESLKQN